MDAGILIARVMLGLAIGAHGAQKVFGWFGGHGRKGTGVFFESLGFRPGPVFALAAGLAESVGGFLTAAGLLGPVGPALIVLVMLVAMLAVHWPQPVTAGMAITVAVPMALVNVALRRSPQTKAHA